MKPENSDCEKSAVDIHFGARDVWIRDECLRIKYHGHMHPCY